MRVDPTELEHAFGAVGKGAEHGEQIRNDDIIALPDRFDRFSTREARRDLAEPALQHLDVNTERHHIQTADFDPLPPMCRRIRIQIVAVKTLQPDMRSEEHTSEL